MAIRGHVWLAEASVQWICLDLDMVKWEGILCVRAVPGHLAPHLLQRSTRFLVSSCPCPSTKWLVCHHRLSAFLLRDGQGRSWPSLEGFSSTALSSELGPPQPWPYRLPLEACGYCLTHPSELNRFQGESFLRLVVTQLSATCTGGPWVSNPLCLLCVVQLLWDLVLHRSSKYLEVPTTSMAKSSLGSFPVPQAYMSHCLLGLATYMANRYKKPGMSPQLTLVLPSPWRCLQTLGCL